jgi:hypothetical protein
VLETKIHEYDELKEQTDREINLLKANLADVEDRKLRTIKDSKSMAGAVQDEENKTLDPVIYGEIEKQVKELHGLCIANQSDGKMGNASCL